MSETPFRPSAEIYDLVYSHLDYSRSAEIVEAIIRERNPLARSLLDMGCGTGLHLEQWRERFAEVEGADVDSAMLDVAARRLPAVPLHLADYTDFDLNRTYDAITCMFSAIGYAYTRELLDAALANMASHLEVGGVLAVEPWLQPHMIRPPSLRTHVAEGEGIVVLRSSRHRYDGDESGGVSDLEMTYLVTTVDGSECFTEQHTMGVFTAEQYFESAERAGLEAEFLDREGVSGIGRGVVVGVKR